MSEAMPEDAIEYWDVTTRTYYERQEDGGVLSRPYNEAENAQADARANRVVLVERVLSASSTNADDVAANAAFLEVTEPLGSDVLAQVAALTRQSSRRAEELCAISRLLLGRLEATSSPIDRQFG